MAPEPEWRPPKRSILLVDDSAFFRELLAPLIKAAGYQVVAVGSAAEALRALKSGTRFDLVVTDIEMPDMDGFGLAEAMRGTPGTAAIPIIALATMVSTMPSSADAPSASTISSPSSIGRD